jgi:hypothetical protein
VASAERLLMSRGHLHARQTAYVLHLRVDWQVRCSFRTVRLSSLDLRSDSVHILLLTKGTVDIDLGRDSKQIFALRKMKFAYTTQQQVVNPLRADAHACRRLSRVGKS